MKTSLVAILLMASLTACSTVTSELSKGLENRLVCTALGDKSYVISEYGPFGLSSKIAPTDTAIVCAKKSQ